MVKVGAGGDGLIGIFTQGTARSEVQMHYFHVAVSFPLTGVVFVYGREITPSLTCIRRPRHGHIAGSYRMTPTYAPLQMPMHNDSLPPTLDFLKSLLSFPPRLRLPYAPDPWRDAYNGGLIPHLVPKVPFIYFGYRCPIRAI